MNDPHPNEGIVPGGQPLPPPRTDGITPIEPGKPLPPPKKPYEANDDDAPMPSLAGAGSSEGAGLQSLAQSARSTQLNQARWTLIIVGILTIGVNCYMLATNRETVVQILRQRGINQVPMEIERLLDLDRYTTLLFIALGGVFILLGIGVKTYPMFCTILGLILYLIGFAVSAALNPASIAQGIIIKIIIVIGLVRAIQAARAYENERNQSTYAD